MAAQVEVQTGEVGRTVAGGRLHLSPLTDSSNKSLNEIPSISQSHVITSEPNKPLLGPKPRLTPKPYAVEKNPTIKPILAPKPQTKPRPQSTHLVGYKPELPISPKPQYPAATSKVKPVATNLNRPAPTSFKTSNKLNSGQATKPVVQPFKPAPPLDPGDHSKGQKPGATSVSYSKSLKTLTAAEWSGTTKKEAEKGQNAKDKSGTSITRAKSMGFLVLVGQEEEEKAKPEVSVPLRPRPRASRPRPVSAIFPDSPSKTETPVPAPRWTARRPLSADLTSKFESIGLSLHRKSTNTNTKENTSEKEALPQKRELDDPPKSTTLQSPDGVADAVFSETAVKEAEEDKRGVSIKSRISLLLDSSACPGAGITGQGSDLHSPVQPVPETEPAVGVKQLIKQLTVDTTPTQSPVVKPVLKPRPLALDLTKRFTSEKSPDLVPLSEATDRHEISKDPYRRAEEPTLTPTPTDQNTFLDLKDSKEQLKKAPSSEGLESGQTSAAGEVQTVRASLFENVVERHSVLMMDDGSTDKDLLSSPSFKRGDTEDEGTLVTATYREPVSPSSPMRVLHAFDTVQAVEENRVVSESVPSAQREDKAMTLRSRRSEGSRPVVDKTDAAQGQTALSERQPRILRIGGLQKWPTGLDQAPSMDTGNLKDSQREEQVSLDEDKGWQREQQDDVAAAPKRLKMLQPEEQLKPKATYFALTGQIHEPVSPGDVRRSIVDTTVPSDDLFLPSALGGSQVKVLPIRRNPSLDEAFGKTSHEQVVDLMTRSHMSPREIQMTSDGWTKEEIIEAEKKREPQKETERLMTKMKESEKDKQKQLEMEKQAHLEFARMKEWEMQRDYERQRQRGFEKEKLQDLEREREKQQLRELEKQREFEREQQRRFEREKQRELERQKESERLQKLQERERQREKERQRQQLEKQKMEELERAKELERQQLLEFEKQKQKEKERQQILELEKQRQREKMEREQVEKIRQMALEQEMLRIRELEKEKERQREMERERQKEIEKEKQRQRELERQRQLEQEMLRIRELEKEMEKERQKEIEKEKLEKQRQRDLERQRQLDMERQELEKQRVRQQEQEKEKQRMKELEKLKEIERRQLLEFEKQKQAERDRLQTLELEKHRLREKMEREEAERMRHIAKQQEAERQRLKEKQNKEEQERLRSESSPLRPKVVDLDSVVRNDQLSKAPLQRGDFATRWKEPYKPGILDIDSFLSPAVLSPSKDLFPVSGIQGGDAESGAKSLPTPERDVSWKVPVQTSIGFSSQVWTTSPQDPWELQPVEMSVDKPAPEPRKHTSKPSPEQLLLRQEDRILNPQRPSSAVLDDLLHLAPFSGTEKNSGNSPSGLPPTELAWLPRELQPQESRRDAQSQRRSQGSQELNRMRSRSVSRRSAPSGSAVDGNLSRMRSRSSHREQNRHSWVQQKQSGEDEETPARETDSQYGTWETGLHTDDSLTPATPSSESNLSPSPRKPSPPHTLGDHASQLETDTPVSLPPLTSSESEPLPFPDAPTTLLDTSALRSKAQLGKKRAPRTRPSRAPRQAVTQPESDGGTTEDWLYKDSTEAKAESKDDDSDSEEQTRGADAGTAVASQPQRIALFPGMDPSALKAQLKKRGDADSHTDGSNPSPSQLSRSPKSPFLPRGALVLPPPGGKENGEENSPQWLKELKSKKRLSQYESET